MKRDFTFISDVVESITRCCFNPVTNNDVSNQGEFDEDISFQKLKSQIKKDLSL